MAGNQTQRTSEDMPLFDDAIIADAIKTGDESDENTTIEAQPQSKLAHQDAPTVSDRQRPTSGSPVITSPRTASTLVPTTQVVKPRGLKHVQKQRKERVQRKTLVQGDIFDLLGEGGAVKGYRGVVASKVAGITYRQLDYWARKRILEPSINPSHGSGSRRLYSFKDILILAVSKRLLDTGVNLQNVTAAITFLNRQTVNQLEHMTIICNGMEVRQCRAGEQVLDLVEEGTAIFAVSVGKMWHEVDLALQNEPCVTVGSESMSDGLSNLPIEGLMEQRMRQQIKTRHIERAEQV
jgi:DNA-binding transcriptional MerR regulator